MKCPQRREGGLSLEPVSKEGQSLSEFQKWWSHGPKTKTRGILVLATETFLAAIRHMFI